MEASEGLANKENFYPVSASYKQMHSVEDFLFPPSKTSNMREPDQGTFLGKRLTENLKELPSYYLQDHDRRPKTGFAEELRGEMTESEDANLGSFFNESKTRYNFSEKEFSLSAQPLINSDAARAARHFIGRPEEPQEIKSFDRGRVILNLGPDSDQVYNWDKLSEDIIGQADIDNYYGWYLSQSMANETEFALTVPQCPTDEVTNYVPPTEVVNIFAEEIISQKIESIKKTDEPAIELVVEEEDSFSEVTPVLTTNVGRKMVDPVMEAKLLAWLRRKCELTRTFPEKARIKSQALHFCQNEQFKASKGWVDKFFRRNAALIKELKIKIGIYDPSIDFYQKYRVGDETEDSILTKLRKKQRLIHPPGFKPISGLANRYSTERDYQTVVARSTGYSLRRFKLK